MTDEVTIRRVEVGFAGRPPIRILERTPGVSNIETDGSTLRCEVWGSFQPFLEALRGHEVILLESVPASFPPPSGEGSCPPAFPPPSGGGSGRGGR